MPTRAGAERHSFAALLGAYLAALRQRGLSVALQERASLVLPRLFAFLRGRRVRGARAVCEAHLIAFAAKLARARNARSGAALSLATRRMYLDAVRAFFRFLARQGAILTDPAAALPRPKIASLPRRVLSQAQALRLVNAPLGWDVLGQRDRAIIETLYGTGLRRGEGLRLDIADVDLGQELLFVRNGKGRKDRMVPLTGRAVAALDAYLKDSRPHLVRDARQAALFLSKRGQRLCPSRLDRMLKRYATAAGIPGAVFPHVLRHTCATHLLKGRANIRHVQQLLGHASLETTAVYTRVAVEDLREVLARSHPRERAWQRAQRRVRR